MKAQITEQFEKLKRINEESHDKLRELALSGVNNHDTSKNFTRYANEWESEIVKCLDSLDQMIRIKKNGDK